MMKEYSKLRLTAAKTRAEVISEFYPEDKFLTKVTQRILEDIEVAVAFDEVEQNNDKI